MWGAVVEGNQGMSMPQMSERRDMIASSRGALLQNILLRFPIPPQLRLPKAGLTG